MIDEGKAILARMPRVPGYAIALATLNPSIRDVRIK
jgi:hypothetical protein